MNFYHDIILIVLLGLFVRSRIFRRRKRMHVTLSEDPVPPDPYEGYRQLFSDNGGVKQ